MSSSQNPGTSAGANSGGQAPPYAADFFAVRNKLCRKAAENAVLVSERGSPMLSEGTSAQPAGSSSSLIHELMGEPEPAVEPESILEPEPARVVKRPPVESRPIVCALPASNAPAKAPASRKRASTASGTPRTRKRGEAGSSAAGTSGGNTPSQFRAKFISTLDEMLEDYGSEKEKLGQELAQSSAKVAQLEERLSEMEGSRTGELAQMGARIDELRGSLGDATNRYYAQKKLRKEKAAEVRRLQRRLERMGNSSGEDTSVAELRARLATISSSLESLEAIYNRDVYMANVEGELAEVSVFRGGQFPSFEAEEERLLNRKAGVPSCEGDFASLLAALRLNCSYEPAPGDPMACDGGEEDLDGGAGAGEEGFLPADE